MSVHRSETHADSEVGLTVLQGIYEKKTHVRENIDEQQFNK